MAQGEIFLGDLLQRRGDDLLAWPSTGHRITATDTGVIMCAHGDLNLQFNAT
jgi:hypothetical protein